MELKESKINYNNNELNYKFYPNNYPLNQLTITFDKNIYNNNKSLESTEVNAYIKNPYDLDEFLILINKFFQQIPTQKKVSPNLVIAFTISTQNQQNEEEITKRIMNTINHPVSTKVIYIDPPKTNEEIINTIKKLQEQSLTATGTKTIQKEGINGKTEQYLKINDTIYDDNTILSINEQKQNLLQQWLQDPYQKNIISTLTPEELDQELTTVITKNHHQYHLDAPQTKTHSSDNLANLSNTIAQENDGKVNQKLGIIENSPDNPNQFTTIEETKEGNLNITNPTINETTITSSPNNNTKITNTTTSNQETFIEEQENQTRDIQTIYYLDSDNNIYDATGELIGQISPNTPYNIDINNNLIKNGQVIGTIENIKDFKITTKNNTKIKQLSPNGYISFMILTLSISLLLIYTIIKIT